MNRILLSVAIILLASSCGSDAGEATTTTSPLTGMAAVDACIAAISEGVDGVDLDAADADTQLEAIFGVEGPEACAFFHADDPASEVGVTDDELFNAILAGLPADLVDYISTPSPAPFEETVDEL